MKRPLPESSKDRASGKMEGFWVSFIGKPSASPACMIKDGRRYQARADKGVEPSVQCYTNVNPAGICTSREVNEARLPRTCSRPCAFEVKKTKKNTKSHQTSTNHTTKYIHSSPATATTSRRRVVKHVPLGSPYSHSFCIDLGYVEIGLVCMHTYVYTRTAAAAAPPVYVLVLYTPEYYFLASAASFLSAVILVCIAGFGVVRWCLTLIFP